MLFTLQGVLYFFMTITGLRFLLFKAVPIGLRHAISAGIGLFICIIGYKVSIPATATATSHVLNLLSRTTRRESVILVWCRAMLKGVYVGR